MGDGERNWWEGQKTGRSEPWPQVPGNLASANRRRLPGLLELRNPTGEDFVIRGFNVQEFDAQANTGFDDADNPQNFHSLFLIAEDGTQPGLER